jgi:anti-sigma factor RsiW
VDRDELEFLISQHFDGTLSAEESTRLHAHLAADAGAQSLYNDHAKLDDALRNSRDVLAIDEAWLTAQISDAIDEGNAKPIRINHWSWAAPLAMAACLLIGLTLGVVFLRDNTEKPIAAVPPALPGPQIAQIVISGNPSAPMPAAGYASVSVGVPANLTPQIVSALYLSRDLSESRVKIQAAGQRSDAFD